MLTAHVGSADAAVVNDVERRARDAVREVVEPARPGCVSVRARHVHCLGMRRTQGA